MATRPKTASPPAHQDHCHARPCQRVAGGGDASVPGRRRCVPVEFQPRHARGSCRALRHDPSARGSLRPPDRHSCRRAGSEAARRHLLRRARVPADRPAIPARSQPDAGRCLAREPAASGDHRGGLDRLLAAAGRRQAAAARGAQARRCTGDRGGRRWSAVGPQGRQRAGRRAADPGADRQGPRRPGVRAGARRQLHRPVVRAAAGGCGGGEGADRRPRLGDGEAREAAGAGQSRRHHGNSPMR